MPESNPRLRDLGDGLIVRRAARADTNALASFSMRVFAHPDTGEPQPGLDGWVRDLMRRPHPTFQPGDFLVVEDTRRHAIVSCMCLISQRWRCEEVEFGVGRPEIVASDPAYRRRGLVRALFEVLHGLSAERGEPVQVISGIPYFYRQFGYEYALLLGGGKISFMPQNIPAPERGGRESYRVRRAAAADLPLVADLYARGARRSLVSCVYDQALWRYELKGRSPDSNTRLIWNVIESRAGTPVGIVAHHGDVYYRRLGVPVYELAAGHSWFDVTPAVLRYLSAFAHRATARQARAADSIGFWLGTEHPAYQALGDRAPLVRDPYAWYIRVADLPAFLTRLAPVLDRRLAQSEQAGFDGVLKLNFFRDGAQLVFERGALTRVAPWEATHTDYGQSGFGNATFPGLTFLQLVFGYRSLEELQAALPDCTTDGEPTRARLNALFPKRASNVLAVS